MELGFVGVLGDDLRHEGLNRCYPLAHGAPPCSAREGVANGLACRSKTVDAKRKAPIYVAADPWLPIPPSIDVSSKRKTALCVGAAGARISPSARGARCGRITATAVTPGATSRTITRVAVPTAG